MGEVANILEDYAVDKMSLKKTNVKCYREEETYRMEANWLGGSMDEKDLGIMVDHEFIMSQQCDAVAKKGQVIMPLRSAVVRSPLHYSIQSWAPHF